MFRAVLKVFYLKLWKQPKDSRGVTWTMLFWVQVLLGLSIGSIVCQQPGGFRLLLIHLLVSWVLNRLSRKPRLARSHPSGRRT